MVDQISAFFDLWFASRGNADAIAERRKRRLNRLVTYATEHSPYFARAYAHLPGSVSELQALPPTEKTDLMRQFDDWVTDRQVTWREVKAFVSDKSLVGRSFQNRYMVWTTSGSSGVPAVLVFDANALTVTTVLAARAVARRLTFQTWAGLVGSGGRIASIFATGGHYLGAAVMSRRQQMFPWRRSGERALSVLAPLGTLVEELNDFQPGVIASYPSMLAILAKEQSAGRLRIDPFLVAAVGETLFSTARQLIERAFDCPVLNNYSASEAPLLTFECEEENLHLNADWYIIEPIDRNREAVSPGTKSDSLLVTNLANYVQPIIRYDLGDSVTVHPERCVCGSIFPVIAVEGRADEILRFRASDGKAVDISPLAITTVVEETPGVYRSQIVQTAEKRLEVRLQCEEGADAALVWAGVHANLRRYLDSQGLAHVTVERADEPPSANPRSGKFRAVWSEIAENKQKRRAGDKPNPLPEG